MIMMERTRTFPIVFAIVVFLAIVPTQYVKGATYDNYTLDVDFSAITGADEVQNNLDPASKNNYDTWDPVPSGVWFGGWPIESTLRLDTVPDTNFVVALATVCRFDSSMIMSGAARTLVRLPIKTSNDPWQSAYLNVYEIDNQSNWTFTKENSTASTFGISLGQMRINFTSGTHRLIFWSETLLPTDTSPTDGNEVFTRSNRTYCFVDAPIHPNRFYLFVTYVKYASDKYVDVFIQTDSLDYDGAWNRSTIATYNKIAPDAYTLEVNNYNVSTGYSFDFRNGFGNSAYGLNIFMNSGDELEFDIYQNLSNVNMNDYITFMLPFRSTVDNVSIDISLKEMKKDGFLEFYALGNGDIEYNDFVLFSMDTDFATCSTAAGLDLTGWFEISLQFNNDTRINVPLWDEGMALGDNRIDRSWAVNPVGGSLCIWDSDETPSYNCENLIQHDINATSYYNYHFAPQASLQWNNYQWVKDIPATSNSKKVDVTENMTLVNKILYGIGGIYLKIGNTLEPIFPNLGGALRTVGTETQLFARWLNGDTDVNTWFGKTWDKLVNLFQNIGQWVWRAAQSIVGALTWLIEKLTYYGSIILGILILILSMVVLFFPIWASAKFSQILVDVVNGRSDRAIAEMGELAGKTSGLFRRGG